LKGLTNMTKSKARLALEAALSEAKTPEARADIANKLARLLDAEGRERGRRRRARARKLAAHNPTPRPDDGDEPFDDPTPATPAPTQEPTDEQRRANRRTMRDLGFDLPHEAIDDEPEQPVAAPIPAAPTEPPVTGWTRTISAFAFPIPNWSGEKYELEVDPQSSLGIRGGDWLPIADDCISSDSYSNADGWGSEARTKDEAERDALWQDYLDKVAGK
jgi:hypothetical protein